MASIYTVHESPGSPLEFSRSSIPKLITIPYGRIFIAATALIEDNKEMRNTYPICTFPFWQLGPPRPLEVCNQYRKICYSDSTETGAVLPLRGSIGLYHESLCLFGQSMSFVPLWVFFLEMISLLSSGICAYHPWWS